MILLDTHAWFWLGVRSERLSSTARAAVTDAMRSGGLAIASVSLVEMAMLIIQGRLTPRGSPEATLHDFIEMTAVSVREITPAIAILATQFPSDVARDPADRIIAATARAEGLALVTRDARLRASRLVETVW